MGVKEELATILASELHTQTSTVQQPATPSGSRSKAEAETLDAPAKHARQFPALARPNGDAQPDLAVLGRGRLNGRLRTHDSAERRESHAPPVKRFSNKGAACQKRRV
eukprot:5834290-Pleurochrysis_carterae.AAC.3